MKSFPSLRKLWFHSSPSYRFLWSNKVPNLRVLNVVDSEIGVKALLPLIHLEELSLSECELSSILTLGPLASKLKSISMFLVVIRAPPSQDASNAFIVSLAHVEVLSILGTELNLGGLEPFSRLARLKTLELAEHSLADLAPLSGLTQLEELKTGVDCTTDWSPIANLKKLCRLSLGGRITQWSQSWARAMHQLPELETLNFPLKMSLEFPLEHL